MRLIHYYVINKETNKREYTHHSQAKCQEYISKKKNKDNYAITHKWVSI